MTIMTAMVNCFELTNPHKCGKIFMFTHEVPDDERILALDMYRRYYEPVFIGQMELELINGFVYAYNKICHLMPINAPVFWLVNDTESIKAILSDPNHKPTSTQNQEMSGEYNMFIETNRRVKILFVKHHELAQLMNKLPHLVSESYYYGEVDEPTVTMLTKVYNMIPSIDPQRPIVSVLKL